MAFMCLLLLAAACAYIFIVVHYGHAWSVVLVLASFVAAFLSIGICFGYSMGGPGFHVETRDMSDTSYYNRRDIGYFFGATLWITTYIIPFVIWNHTNGISLPFEGVCIEYAGNTLVATAFLIWFRLFVFE